MLNGIFVKQNAMYDIAKRLKLRLERNKKKKFWDFPASTEDNLVGAEEEKMKLGVFKFIAI